MRRDSDCASCGISVWSYLSFNQSMNLCYLFGHEPEYRPLSKVVELYERYGPSRCLRCGTAKFGMGSDYLDENGYERMKLWNDGKYDKPL